MAIQCTLRELFCTSSTSAMLKYVHVFWIIGPELQAAVADILPAFDVSLPVYAQGECSQQPGDWRCIDDLLLKSSSAQPDASIRSSFTARSPACYIYTSGTTGAGLVLHQLLTQLVSLQLIFNFVCCLSVIFGRSNFAQVCLSRRLLLRTESYARLFYRGSVE